MPVSIFRGCPFRVCNAAITGFPACPPCASVLLTVSLFRGLFIIAPRRSSLSGSLSFFLTGICFRNGLPHFLQKNIPSPRFSDPQTGQTTSCRCGTGGGVSDVTGISGDPHRSQNRDCPPVNVLPHDRHTIVPGVPADARRSPHLWQKQGAPAETGAPHLLQCLIMNFGSRNQCAP